MRLLHYIEIENFKTFSSKQRIELHHPAVIIGPNNCGKTSVIQAMALWSMAVKTWHEVRKDSKAKKRTSVQLNRLNIVTVPVQQTHFFWNNVKTRKGSADVLLSISVGVELNGKVESLSMGFRNKGEDLVYCFPDGKNKDNQDLIAYAASLNVNILYCMSGLETDEAVLKPNRIDMHLGKGQTAQVLRNLCLMVYQKSPEDWRKNVELMKRLFHVQLDNPVENSKGGIDLYYTQDNSREPFEIASSGRGFQQILLIFSYLFSHKKSVLLIDEPDAHLEILRQKQIFVLLRDYAAQNDSQVVMVTHSEVVLEEALDTNLTLLLDGHADNLAGKPEIRQSLKFFGTDHYIRARERGYVLYIEGSTDIDILSALAKKIKHPAAEVWDECVNTFYVQNTYPEITADTELERVEGGFGTTPKIHFDGLRKLLPELKGLALLDNDGRNRQDKNENGLITKYWKRYEIENYFITPDLLLRYINNLQKDLGLFTPDSTLAENVLEELIQEQIFESNSNDFNTWKQSPKDAARLIWESKTERMKMSKFTEEFFRRVSQKTEFSILLSKGEFHQLIDYIDINTIPDEVGKNLDMLEELFKYAKPIITAKSQSEKP